MPAFFNRHKAKCDHVDGTRSEDGDKVDVATEDEEVAGTRSEDGDKVDVATEDEEVAATEEKDAIEEKKPRINDTCLTYWDWADDYDDEKREHSKYKHGGDW